MQVYVRLHGILRDSLPAEAKGRIVLSLPDGSNVSAVLSEISPRRPVHVAVNGEIVDDLTLALNEGDKVELFRPAAGG